MKASIRFVSSTVLALAVALAPSAFAQNQQVPDTRQSQSLPSLAPLIDSVKAAVVNVDVTSHGPHHRLGGGEENPEEDNPFQPFFGGPQGHSRERLMFGKGSGTVIDPKGLILTNNHVVEGAVSIDVKLEDGRSFPATVVGRDPATDVALIRLKGNIDNLPFVKLGDSDALRVGDWVVAIGDPFGLTSSVSAGIISAKARNIHAGSYDDFLQTDAAINPGNSGGPLFNMRGEVIGINTAIAGTSGGSVGIGFAVPSNLAKALLPQLEKEGTVTRGWLGLAIGPLNPSLVRAMRLPSQQGAIVYSVNPGSPAERAGLKADDVVLALDGAKIASGDALTRAVAMKRPGSVATLNIWRAGQKTDVKVALGKRPDLDTEGNPTSSDENGSDSQDEENRKQRVGLGLRELSPALAQNLGLPPHGALITEVTPGSPADRAGLEQGMLIVEADHRAVTSTRDLTRTLHSAKPGSTMLLRVVVPGGRGSSIPIGLDLP